jgi:hypothetical protein
MFAKIDKHMIDDDNSILSQFSKLVISGTSCLKALTISNHTAFLKANPFSPEMFSASLTSC